MADATKRKAKLPKDVSQLTGDELMRKVFNKRTVEELKKTAREKGQEKQKGR